MKRIALLILSAMTMMAAFSCTKELKDPVDMAGDTVNFTVRAELPDYDEATKSTLVNTVRVKWEDGDKIYVYDNQNFLGFLYANNTDSEGKVTYLSGEIDASQATTLTLVSMTNDITPSVPYQDSKQIGGGITFDLSSQNFDGAPYVAYATVSNNITSGITASFTFATAVESVFCTGLKESTKVDNVTIQGVNTQLTIIPASSGDPDVNAATVGSISMNNTKTSVGANADGVMAFSVALLKQEAAKRMISVTQNNTLSEAKFTAGGALNVGTSYSTVAQLNQIPDDALLGVFSVGATKQVHFSKGNLYAKKESDVWKWGFYDEQYQYNSILVDNSGVRTATDGDTEIDLFTWGYDNTSTNASYSLNPVNTAGISGHTTDGDKQFSSSEDWGYVFGGESSVWRTLTSAEWKYLFAWTESESNTDTSSPRYNLHKYAVTVCGKTNCVVLLPDGWKWDENADEHNVGISWQEEGYPETQTGNEVTWKKMEDAGAVCLPAAGSRNGFNVNSVGDSGYYWSSTADVNSSACYVLFNSSKVDPDIFPYRSNGFSVRLITDVK